jgi:arsenate reductase
MAASRRTHDDPSATKPYAARRRRSHEVRALRLHPQRRPQPDRAGVLERYAPEDLRAESAGQAPADAIWPNVIEAMREVGIDISERKPKPIDREMQLHADKAITLNCQESCPYVIGGVEDWDVDDPAGAPLEKVREIRDEIERRVRSKRPRPPRRSAPAPTQSSPSTPTLRCALSFSPSRTGRYATASEKKNARCSRSRR